MFLVDLLTVFSSPQLTMKDLLTWVRGNLIKERPEMFMKEDTVYVKIHLNDYVEGTACIPKIFNDIYVYRFFVP